MKTNGECAGCVERHDASGLRVAEYVNDLWRFGGKLIAEYGGLPSTDESGVKYVLQDWQGSTRAIVGNTGNVQSRTDYTAFGENMASGTGLRNASQGFGKSGSLRQGYALTEKDDATGLDHTWFRKNENQAGRWTSPDPYNGSMNLGDPQSFNRYSYVENEPTNFVDPSGLNMAAPGFYVCYDLTTYWTSPSGNRTETTTICHVFGGGYSSGSGGGHEIGHTGGGGGGGGSSSRGSSVNAPCPPVPTHPANADIDANIEEAKKHGPASAFNPFKVANDLKQMLWFRDQVKNKGPWDYKQVGKKAGQPSPYADFGNFNYGATGIATGLFTEWDLLVQAGATQIAAGTSKPEWGSQPSANPLNLFGSPPYGDDPKDQEQIIAGIAYFRAKEAGCR